jgi:histidine triad (HIT) family protein
MEERPCVFCQIVSKRIPAKVVYEDDNSIAILDINPRSKGMSLIIPKQHYDKFDENFDLSSKVFQTALIVAEKIKKGLDPKSVSFSIIDSPTVPHFHIRLYPVYEDELPLGEGEPQKVTEMELNVLAEKIKGSRVDFSFEVKKEKIEEQKPEEEKKKERSKEEAYWIKRELDLG